MSTQNYTLINGNYEPVNATACSGIRCMSCNVFFPPDKMEEHLNTHINPSHQKISKHSKKMSRVNIPQVLEDSSDIQTGIRSVLPQELPSIQKKKRHAIFLHQQELDQTHSEMSAGEVNVRQFEEKDIVSQIVDSYIDPEQQQQFIQVPKKVRFDQEVSQVKKKGIQLYQNSGHRNEILDQGGEQEKKLLSYHRVTGAYELEQVPMDESRQTQSQPKMKAHSYNLQARKKQPRMSLNISTASHKKPAQEIQQTSFKKITEEEDHTIIVSARKYECPECKGFYCDTCKSFIPPIYRPVPDTEGKYHFHPNMESMEFYQQRFYSKQKDVCTNCQKKF